MQAPSPTQTDSSGKHRWTEPHGVRLRESPVERPVPVGTFRITAVEMFTPSLVKDTGPPRKLTILVMRASCALSHQPAMPESTAVVRMLGIPELV
jgi:hypothetical protein